MDGNYDLPNPLFRPLLTQVGSQVVSRLLQEGDLLDAGLEPPDELLVKAGVVDVEDVRQGGVNHLVERVDGRG